MRLYRQAMVAIAGFLLLALILLIIFFAVGQQEIGSGILERQESGRLAVSADQQPISFAQRRQAPAFALLPTRTTSKAVGGDLQPADIEPLLATWESFSPQQIAIQEHKQNVNPYRRALQRVSEETSLDTLSRRLDASDFPTVCPEKYCSAGWQWLPGSFGGMQIRAYQPPEAYVTGYGLVRYRSDRGADFDSKQGKIYYRAYGLLLNNSSGAWRLQRVAAETVSQLD